MSDPNDERASALGPGAAEARGPAALPAEPSDPREKEAALLRLRDATDEELALFEDSLREGALDAGATEREMRDAQSDHPSHSG